MCWFGLSLSFRSRLTKRRTCLFPDMTDLFSPWAMKQQLASISFQNIKTLCSANNLYRLGMCRRKLCMIWDSWNCTQRRVPIIIMNNLRLRKRRYAVLKTYQQQQSLSRTATLAWIAAALTTPEYVLFLCSRSSSYAAMVYPISLIPRLAVCAARWLISMLPSREQEVFMLERCAGLHVGLCYRCADLC